MRRPAPQTGAETDIGRTPTGDHRRARAVTTITTPVMARVAGSGAHAVVDRVVHREETVKKSSPSPMPASKRRPLGSSAESIAVRA